MTDTDIVPVDPAALAAEIATLQGQMQSDYIGWMQSPEKRGRYQSLLAAQQAGGRTANTPSGGDTLPQHMTADGLLKIPSMSEAAASGITGSDYGQLLRIHGRVADVLVGIDTPADRTAAIDAFDRLPPAVQTQALRELMGPALGRAPHAEPSHMARFGSTADGRALIEEWGGDAPQRVARVAERVERVLDRLSEADGDALMAWLDNLPSAAFRAVARQLSA